MSTSITWSPDAEQSLEELLEWLHERWGAKVVSTFLQEIDSALTRISKLPYLHPLVSPKKGIRKCLLRKKTLMFYRVRELGDKTEIELLLFVDGRQNPLNFQF